MICNALNYWKALLRKLYDPGVTISDWSMMDEQPDMNDLSTFTPTRAEAYRRIVCD